MKESYHNYCKHLRWQKQPGCKKGARPSKVESYLKDESMHGMANNKGWYLDAAKA